MMKNRRDLVFLIAVVSLTAIVSSVGFYVRTGGTDVLLATLVAAIPAAFVIVVTSIALRNASLRTQLIWCIALIILLRSVALWKPGVDYLDEFDFIGDTMNLFQKNVLSGYLNLFPVNIIFAGIFYGFYTYGWRNLESFEFLQFLVYPLLVFGYYFMSKEIAKLKSNLFFSQPYIPAAMFLAFAPVFTLVPTYYWPQLLGTALLCFAFGSLLHVLLTGQERFKWIIITIGLSIFLTFVHNITCFLYLATIFFFFLSMRDSCQRHVLMVVGGITFVSFMGAHLDQYSPLVQRVILAVLGNADAAAKLGNLRFTGLSSMMARSPVVTLANTGFFLVIGLLILACSLRVTYAAKMQPLEQKRLLWSFRFFIGRIFNDPLAFSFLGFSVTAALSGILLAGLFDPVRLISWVSLLALPRVVPSGKLRAVFFMIVLLGLFFLLVWIVNSPWGSPFYSNPNLNPHNGTLP